MLFVTCKSSRSGVATVETAHGPATVGLIAASTGDGCVRSAGTMTSRTGRCERRDFSGVDRRGLRTQATYVPRPFAGVGVGRAPVATDGDVIKLLTDGTAACASAAAAAAGKSLVTHGVTSR